MSLRPRRREHSGPECHLCMLLHSCFTWPWLVFQFPAADKHAHSMMLPSLQHCRDGISKVQKCLSWSESPSSVFWQNPGGLNHCPSGRFFSLNTAKLELYQSDCGLLNHPPDYGPLPQLLRLTGQPAQRVLVVPNFYIYFFIGTSEEPKKYKKPCKVKKWGHESESV